MAGHHGAGTLREYCRDSRRNSRRRDVGLPDVAIRQNTRALRSTTIQSVMQSEIAMMSLLVENVATWEKIQSGAPLASGEETRKAIVLFNVYMIETESRYHQIKTGYLDAQPWEGRLGTLPGVVRLPIFNLWRSSPGGKSHASNFLALLDELAKGELK